ncbi:MULTISPECIES: hypothetical protein [unclassified Acinetobacter]|uniref:hypothetical protein n=1 Tax=unclassified Acinetobacter TaxID=196816 RepID=UPI0007D048A6|nr:hypothetical protein [Acinetobacter sp. SFA]OAL78283.1 hypothetical protein AY607_07360 [Acinetobacter sp. SFA]
MAKEKVISKEEFFQNIYECALGNFSTMQAYMGIYGIMEQVFGVREYEDLGSAYELPTFKIKQDEEKARTYFRNSSIWYPFEWVYEYAVNGNGYKCCIDELTDCVDFIHIIHSDHFQITAQSNEIVTMALVRHALEHDPTVNYFDADNCNYPKAIAQLAGIDLRTLKNAISAGEIETVSKYVLCATSLKHWLLRRKGFKPTFYKKEEQQFFFNSPLSFSNTLKDAKKELTTPFNPSDLLEKYPEIPNVIEQLESGIFNLPLDSVSIIAKAYGIPYPILLKEILKTFYPNELAILTN